MRPLQPGQQVAFAFGFFHLLDGLLRRGQEHVQHLDHGGFVAAKIQRQPYKVDPR